MKSFKLNYFANGSKKAKTTNRNFQLKDVVADEDYILFLNCYCVDSDNDFNSGSDDDSDPQYSMFLENLSENGNSYVLKVARDNKICHIEYEEEDKSCDEIKRNCRRRVTWRSDSMREKTQSPVKLQKTENPIALRSTLRRERIGYPRIMTNCKKKVTFRSNLGIEKTESPKKLEKTENARTTRGALSGEGIEYPRIMTNCKKSVTLRSNLGKEKTERPKKLQKTENDPRVVINYKKKLTLMSNLGRQKTKSPINLQKSETARTWRSASRRGRSKSPRNIINVSGKEKSDCLKPMKKNLRAKTTKRNVIGKEGKSLAVEMNGDRQPVFGGTMACSNRRSGSADTHLAKHESQCQMKCDITVDQSYEVFLNFVEKGGCSMMFKGEESGSDSEIMVMDSDPYCNETTPFVPSRVFDSSCFSDEKILGKKKWCFSGNHSQFRKRLIELLERPYDQKEYESLWQEVSRRRQKEGGKESRRGRRTYPIDAVGRSYLDLHTDLGEKIDQFSECNKRLFLLRGFFFWLQNKVHDGAFQPWLDSSCLKMLCDM